jgi:hypothetical protein
MALGERVIIDRERNVKTAAEMAYHPGVGMKLRAAFLVGNALAIAACILDADGFTGGLPTQDAAAPTAPDASHAASNGTPDASDAAPSLPNLLNNSDFELGCAGWKTQNTTAIESDVARSGVRSCLVCATAGDALFEQTVPLPLEAGAELVGEVWLRAAPKADASIAAELRLVGTATTDQYGPTATVGAPTTQWVRTSALLPLNRTITAARFDLHITSPAGSCILVDDAALYQTR